MQRQQEVQTQIPFGNDKRSASASAEADSLEKDSKKGKCNGNSKCKRRFPSGMTKEVQVQQRIPFGNDSKKGKCNGNSKCKRRFPSGMTKEVQVQTQIPFGNDKRSASATADSLRE